jgi:5-formyltetrahydrofolate cyclo-ligase
VPSLIREVSHGHSRFADRVVPLSAYRPHVQENSRSKAELRQAIKAAIGQLDPACRRAQDSALLGRFLTLPGLSEAGRILLFVPAFPEEPPMAELLLTTFETKKEIYLPRVDKPGQRLRLYRVTDPAKDLCNGALGIPEPRPELPEVSPEVIDWALVPGLAFDELGFRLGRGAGYYDRLLPLLRPRATCWALCLSCQLVKRLPVQDHDMPLNGVSTPERDVFGLRGA